MMSRSNSITNYDSYERKMELTNKLIRKNDDRVQPLLIEVGPTNKSKRKPANQDDDDIFIGGYVEPESSSEAD